MISKFCILGVIAALSLVTACVPPTSAPPSSAPKSAAPNAHKMQIVDAETGAPLADAVLDLHYFPSRPEAPNADHPQATADAEGEVTIEGKAEPTIWQVQAGGYIEQRLTGNAGALPPRYAVHATGDYAGVIHLYRQPAPQLTILVGDTYTGPVTINLQPAPGFDYVLIDPLNVAFAAVDAQASYIQAETGTRVFTETASAQGVVDLPVTPLLYDLEAHQLQIRDNAGVLPYYDIADPQNKERGVWGNVNEDDKRLNRQIRLFVGTLVAYQKFLQAGR